MLSVLKRFPVAIIGIAVLLCANAALIVLGWLASSEAPLSIDPVTESSWTAPDLDAPPAASAREPEQGDPVLARPIFFAARKPFEPPPVSEVAPPLAPPKPPPPDPVFVVDGIMLTGGVRKVHLRQLREVDGHWYRTGQVIDNWTIVQIDAAGIVLEQADRRFAMRLYSSDSDAFRTVRRSSRRTTQ